MFILVNPRQLIPTPSMRQWTVSGNGLSPTRCHPAGTLKLDQRVGAFATRPWQRRRGSVALTGRRGTAKLQPGIRLQRTRGKIVPGPGVQSWVLNWACLVSWDPFLTHQRCGPCCGTLVCECNGDIDDLYIFKKNIYISHNFVWIHNVVKQNSRCASVCYDLKSWNIFWYSA